MGQGKDDKRFSILNFLLVALTAVSGVLWWLIGEVFYPWAADVLAGLGAMRYPLICAIYFAMLILLMIFAAVSSEYLVHSVVEKEYFDKWVFTPQLKLLKLPICIVTAFLAAGLLQFLYQIEPSLPPSTPSKPVVTKTAPHPVKTGGIDDFYFIIDNSTSMSAPEYPGYGNDPNNERLRILSSRTDKLPESSRVALVAFGPEAEVVIPLQYATDEIKERIRGFTEDPKIFYGRDTNVVNYLKVTSKILSKQDYRKGIVFLITDGESADTDYETAVTRFAEKNIPIYTIGLNTTGSSIYFELLQKIADATGGKHSTVDNFTDLETVVVDSIQEEEKTAPQTGTVSGLNVNPDPARVILERRDGKREKSALYSIFHIAIICLIGLLSGFLLYMIFTRHTLKRPFLISGAVSGLMAGLALELGLQNPGSSGLMRLLACVIISTLFWFICFFQRFMDRKLDGKNLFTALFGFGTKDAAISTGNTVTNILNSPQKNNGAGMDVLKSEHGQQRNSGSNVLNPGGKKCSL
jgi:Ca-activated chloride channel family protein